MARPKNSHGEGSFRERKNGTLEFRFTLENGVRRSVYGRTKSECRTKARQVITDFENGLTARGRSQTVRHYLTTWLANNKARLRPRTWDGYNSAARNRIFPALGDIRIDRLTGHEIQTLYASLLTSELSAASVQRTHALLHKAFRDAVKSSLLAWNPADRATPPRAERPEFATLTKEQVRRLIESTVHPKSNALYAVAATTGLRQGEQLGLLWRDVDFDGKELGVRRALTFRKGEGLVLSEVKTARSRRSVALSDVAVKALRAWSTAQKEERLMAGSAWRDTGLVFTDERGGPLKPQRVTREFKEQLLAAKLPAVRYHDLRHTAATLLLEAGTHPKVVQEMLGHATIAVTMDTYSHVLPHMQEAAASVFDRALGG